MELGQSTPRVEARAAREHAAAIRAGLIDALPLLLERDRFAQRMAELVARVTGYPHIALYARPPLGDDLLLRASTLPGADDGPARLSLDRLGAVTAAGVNDTQDALLLPLARHGAIIGALVVVVDGRGFDARAQRVVELVADALAPALLVAEEHHALRQVAMLDLATGASASWFLAQRVDEEIARAQRSAKRVTVVVIGVPEFDALRNHHAFARVNELLRDLAHGLRAVTRAFDIVAYQGAGMFAVALPDSDSDEAAMVIDRIQAQASRVLGRFDDELRDGRPGTAPQRVLAGAATYPQDGDRVASLLLTAEHRLDEDRAQLRRATEGA